MNSTYQLVLLGSIGVLVQLIFTLGKKAVNAKTAYAILAAILLDILFFVRTRTDNLFWIASLVILSGCFYMFYKNELLPKIHESAVVFNCAVCYYCIYLVVSKNHVNPIGIGLILLPLLPVFFLIISKNDLSKFWKITFYLLNMSFLATIVLVQFTDSINLFTLNNHYYSIPAINAIITGMFVFILVTYVGPFFEFIPGKHERNYKQRIKEHITCLISKYENFQISLRNAFATILIIAIIVALNFYLKIWSPLFLASVLIITHNIIDTEKLQFFTRNLIK